MSRTGGWRTTVEVACLATEVPRLVGAVVDGRTVLSQRRCRVLVERIITQRFNDDASRVIVTVRGTQVKAEGEASA